MNSSGTPRSANQDHYIVAIGASAGGLEAIHEFFDNMSPGGTFSFVIIQHLSPDYKSLLVELVAKHTHMKVLEAGDNMPLEPNCVYVIPNDKLLRMRGGNLLLEEKKTEKAPNTAIDTFFRSLAEDQGPRAIAVILSGTGSDGTRGAEAIQRNGGLVIVQEPSSAKFDGMPNSAIAGGFTDMILAPEVMPGEILAYVNEYPVRKSGEAQPDESALPEILNLIEKNCGYDFYHYKTPTILRRIARRMIQLNKKDFAEYMQMLRSSPEECRTLGKEFLIGVTSFFRDAQAYEVLRSEVLPLIINSKKDGEVLKVWVAACSTGQEAYSICILIDDVLRRLGKNVEVKIFATDVDADAVEFAARGVYSLAAVQDIEPGLLKKYFIVGQDSASITSHIRKQIVFARHNVLKDPPFIKNDLISCRNMLIYMNPVLQKKVLGTLQFSLVNGGFLFLGPSEVPASIKDSVEEVNGKWKIFRKTKDVNPYNIERFHSALMTTAGGEQKRAAARDAGKTLRDDLQEILTEQFGYAAVSIDSQHEVKDAVGDFKKYLFLPDNVASLNLMKMVTRELAVALNAAIRKAEKDKKTVTLNNIRMRPAPDQDKLVNIFVRPNDRSSLTTVVFSETQESFTSRSLPETGTPAFTDAGAYVNDLEEELREARMNLQLAVESLETTNEELQSSNEELLSANEELQSSNEELQSLNEELHTLNTEHQLRIKELNELNDDLNNYFRSTDIGQIFVDRDLRVRKFNHAAVNLVNLIESDIGRPIDHFTTNILDTSLVKKVREVMQTQKQIEKEVHLSNGAVSLMRVLPYVRQDGQVDGVVMTFYDISGLKELDNIIKGVFNSSSSAIMAFRAVRDHKNEIRDLLWVAANHASDRLLARTNNYAGRSFRDELPSLVENGLFDKLKGVATTGKAFHGEMQLLFNHEIRWYEIISTKMEDGLVVTFTDINEKKLAEEKFRQSYQELVQVKENLKILNAKLEEKVGERTQQLAESEERFRLISDATSDVVWDWNLVTNEIWWSDSLHNKFGHNLPSDHTKTSAFWLNKIHPDDRPRIKESIQKAISEGATDWMEHYRFMKSDGSYAVLQDKGAVIMSDSGEPMRMVGSMTDITTMERAEQELRLKNEELQNLIQEFRFVTDFMPQMVWATRPDGYHDFYNKQWFDFTGLDYETTKDKGWSLVLHPDDFDRAWKVWRHSLDTGDVYEIEYRMRRHDGEYRWFLGRAIPLKDESGKILKWFGTCTDVHDQKSISDVLEQKVVERTLELQRSNEVLEDTNAELMQFASVASHDLKEPLRKIHMFSNIIKDRYLTDTDKGAMDYMNRIINSSARMTKLINDLLSYSRLSVESFFEPVNLNKVIEEVQADLELFIQEKKARIKVGKLPEIEGIPGQLRQVFQNLISNSLKFSKPGEKPEIKISAELIEQPDLKAQSSRNGSYVRITLNDNGIGFDEKYASKIFTIFQRLHPKEKYDGTGIGLAITKKIVDKHNGLIAAEGKEGEGSSFTMILPVKQHMANGDKVVSARRSRASA